MNITNVSVNGVGVKNLGQLLAALRLTDWIAVREPGCVVYWLKGTEVEVAREIESLNATDDSGSISVHIGPVTPEEAKEEFYRLLDHPWGRLYYPY